MVSILSLSKKPRTGQISIMALLGSKLLLLAGNRATDITLEGQEPVLPGTAKMTLIVPKGGLEESSLRGSKFVWPPWPLEWCNSYFNFPSQTN